MARKKVRDMLKPFTPEIIARARRIAPEYHIVVSYGDSWFYGHCEEMQHVMSGGETKELCIKNVNELILLELATMLERGIVPPDPWL